MLLRVGNTVLRNLLYFLLLIYLHSKKLGKMGVLINGIDIENNRVNLLDSLNFISPYIELPKKLTVKENLTVYGKLYDVKNLNEKIEYLSEKLRLDEIIKKITSTVAYLISMTYGTLDFFSLQPRLPKTTQN